jgi:predicted RNA binding protein YcfA (HicA-like mRNA interferase family)
MRVAEAEGWVHKRTRGDHFVFQKDGRVENIAIPDHRPLKEGTLRGLLKKMQMTPDDFLRQARK